MIVTAECIKEVFDCGLVEKGVRIREPRYYFRGPVPGFDTDIKALADQVTDSGFWCFQYEGHRGRNPEWVEAREKAIAARTKANAEKDGVPEIEPVKVETAVTVEEQKGKKWSRNTKAAARRTRAANKAARLARIRGEAEPVKTEEEVPAAV